jgi:copper transport protein
VTTVKERPRTRTTGAPRGPAPRRVVAFMLLVLACWGTLLAIAAPVSSDVPVLRSTSPGVGSTTRPDNLVLTFDRPVDAGLATVRMTGPYNQAIDPGRPTNPDGRTNVISVPIPKQKYAGTYTVAWSVPAGTLNTASGTFVFDLASRSPVQPPPQLATRPDVVVTVAHGILVFGALVSVALLAATAFVTAISPTGVSGRTIATYAWFGAVGCTALSVLTFGPYAAKLPLTDAFDGGLFSGTFGSAGGAALLARLALLALGGLAVAQLMTCEPAPTRRERWWRGATVLGCTAAVAATWSFAEPGALELTLALIAMWWLGRRLSADKPRWPAFVQAGVGALIAAAAVVLTVSVATEDRTQAPPVRLAFDTENEQGMLDLVVTPGKIGGNRVQVSVVDFKDVSRDGFDVSVALNPPDGSAPLPVPLSRVDTGYSVGSVDIPSAGQWELALTVQSAGGEQQTIYGTVDVPG